MYCCGYKQECYVSNSVQESLMKSFKHERRCRSLVGRPLWEVRSSGRVAESLGGYSGLSLVG